MTTIMIITMFKPARPVTSSCFRGPTSLLRTAGRAWPLPVLFSFVLVAFASSGPARGTPPTNQTVIPQIRFADDRGTPDKPARIDWAGMARASTRPISAIALQANSATPAPTLAQENREPLPPIDAEPNANVMSNRIDQQPIGQLTVNIREKPGELPADVAATVFNAFEPIVAETEFVPSNLRFSYRNPAFSVCYRPLYFEQRRLERYGISHGFFQPALSGAHFFGTTALLPYKLMLSKPWHCECSFHACTSDQRRICLHRRNPLDLSPELAQASFILGWVLLVP